MNRGWDVLYPQINGVPRTRGDEPHLKRLRELEHGRSPHTRG